MPIVFVPIAFREQEAKQTLMAVNAIIQGAPEGALTQDHPLATAQKKLEQTIRAVCGQ